MAEAQQLQVLPVMEVGDAANSTGMKETRPQKDNTIMMKWLRIAAYTVIAISSGAVASLLSRLYYEKGGQSKWLGTLIQAVGFPLLFPFYFFMSQPKVSTPSSDVDQKPRSLSLLVFVYVFLGLLWAGSGYLMSVGFEYLPVSIVSLIAATQLAFNAFFSYFLNSQKFTPYIVNSLVLLTISSVLMVANSSTEKPPGVSDREYAAGFICTFLAAAINGLSLACQQLAFRKVLKMPTIKSVLELVIYQSLVESIFIMIGFMASGEWKGLTKEMEGYELGKVSYVMTLVWATIAFQVSTFGGVGLVFEVSALFCNVIGALALPIVPIVSMIVFHDKMGAVKGIAMVLAVWGFVSYVYQNYVDDCKMRNHIAETKNDTAAASTSQLSEV